MQGTWDFFGGLGVSVMQILMGFGREWDLVWVYSMILFVGVSRVGGFGVYFGGDIFFKF